MLRTAIAALAFLALALPAAEAKSFRIKPGLTAEQELQAAIAQAQSGDTIHLRRGRFELVEPLTLSANGLTFRGDGPDRSVLSFRSQIAGAASLTVSGDGAVLKDFAVEDARGDAIVAPQADGLQAVNLRVEWTAGPRASNGARGLAAVGSENVMIDRVIARGASDAGIFVAQARNVIVQRSRAEGNVIGVLVENSSGVDVLQNSAAANTVGVAIVNLPGLPGQDGRGVRVAENEIAQNDTPNFAAPGSLAATIPPGVGVLVLAARDAHIVKNTIGEHGTANVLIASYRNPIADPNYNPLSRDVMVRANTFGRTGYAPRGELAEVTQRGFPLPDILWDGAGTYVAAGVPRSEAVRIGIAENVATRPTPVSFLSLGLPFASSPMSEIQPDPTMLSPLLLPELPAIRIRR